MLYFFLGALCLIGWQILVRLDKIQKTQAAEKQKLEPADDEFPDPWDAGDFEQPKRKIYADPKMD